VLGAEIRGRLGGGSFCQRSLFSSVSRLCKSLNGRKRNESSFSFLGGRNPAGDPLHMREKTADTPVVGDLAVLDAHDIERLAADPAASWSDAEEMTFLRAAVGLVRRHPVTVRELPVDLRMKVRKCRTDASVELSQPGLVGSRAGMRCVIDEVLREKFFENFEVSHVLDLFDISADNSLCRLGGRDAAPLADLLAANRLVDGAGKKVKVGAQYVALEYETGESAFANDFDQAGRLQLFGVMRQGRGADPVSLVQRGPGHGVPTGAGLLQNSNASRFRQSSSDSRKLKVCQTAILRRCHSEKMPLTDSPGDWRERNSSPGPGAAF